MAKATVHNVIIMRENGNCVNGRILILDTKWHYVSSGWQKEACGNLGIAGVDLYGGTKNSTATALRAALSPEQIQRGAKISTNKAFQRYLQMNDQDALEVYRSAAMLTKNAQHPHNASGMPTRKKQ